VGHVTRCVHSPRLEKNIGFANVPTEQSGIGSELLVDTSAGERQARVVPLPFVESKKAIAV